MNEPKLILLTGVTGYVGKKLLPALEQKQLPVLCLVRNLAKCSVSTSPTTTLKQGDLLDKASLMEVLKGVKIAYYLVHSMASKGNFKDEEKISAQNFGEAASFNKVEKIIYLGGLGKDTENLSPHLKSRHDVGALLRKYAEGVQVIEFRASIVIGTGSLSYEMIRSLSERLPVMIAPRWLRTKAQPIAIKDLLSYLIAAIDVPLQGNPIFEIGGRDQATYADIIKTYSLKRGLKRYLLPVPVLSPRLSSLWLALVTPLYAQVGRKLVESATFETLVTDKAASKIFEFSPIGYKEAISLALKEKENEVSQLSLESLTEQDIYLSHKEVATVQANAEQSFRPIEKIGGSTGYYYANWIWLARGIIDAMFGGVGFRRGRKDTDVIRVGDHIDFWQVELYEPNKRLRLRADTLLPGKAWLEFTVREMIGKTTIKQVALFEPWGLFGLLYWYALFPVHFFLFRGMMKGIVKAINNEEKKA